MSDTLAMAKSAREALARALSALQSDPTAPPDWMDIAEPISEAMGALFRVERSQGDFVEQVSLALDAARKALALLQARSGHPAFEQAMESVAASLGTIHALSRTANQPAPIPLVVRAPTPEAAPAPAPTPAPTPAPHAHAPAPAPAPTPAAAPSPAPAHAPSLRLEVALAAHSPSNLYKGLSGDDIVDDGGIFVATYDIPKLGQSVWLRVLLPGGYQFEALGVVRWTRETDGDGIEPGFGVKIERISNEGRQLLARYARHREPIFYDDV